MVAFDVNVVGASHGLGVSGVDAGGSCRDRRLISLGGGCLCGKLCCWEYKPVFGWESKTNGSSGLLFGGFFGVQAPLSPNPSSQLFFIAPLQYFSMKVRKFTFFSAGILSFVTWLAMRAQLSK